MVDECVQNTYDATVFSNYRKIVENQNKDQRDVPISNWDIIDMTEYDEQCYWEFSNEHDLSHFILVYDELLLKYKYRIESKTMNKDINALIAQYAKLKVYDKQYWELVYGENGDKALEPAYSNFIKKLKVAYQSILSDLKEMGYPVQEYVIRGQAPGGGISHYYIDDAIKAEFDDEVIVDSEHSQLFIYTTERVKDTVYARVLEMAGTGMVTLYSGDTYPGSFLLEKDDELQIGVVGSWSSAERWLNENS